MYFFKRQEVVETPYVQCIGPACDFGQNSVKRKVPFLDSLANQIAISEHRSIVYEETSECFVTLNGFHPAQGPP